MNDTLNLQQRRWLLKLLAAAPYAVAPNTSRLQGIPVSDTILA